MRHRQSSHHESTREMLRPAAAPRLSLSWPITLQILSLALFIKEIRMLPKYVKLLVVMSLVMGILAACTAVSPAAAPATGSDAAAPAAEATQALKIAMVLARPDQRQ